jgi:hypothetical protein
MQVDWYSADCDKYLTIAAVRNTIDDFYNDVFDLRD